MEWKEVRLGDVCSISSSKRIFAKEYQSFGVPFYRGKEIIEKQKGYKVSNGLFITRERYEEIKEKFGVPQNKELLLTSVGTLGVPYVVKDEEFYFKDGNITWFRNFNELDVEYLYYWFLSPYGRNEIDSKAIGSTQKALTIETLCKFNIKIPTNIDDQRRIASILSSLDRKIELNNKINAELEEMAQAIFKNWLSNCSEEVSLSEISLNITDYEKCDADKVVLINSSDVTEGFFDHHNYTPNKDLKGHFKKRFQKGDVLYSQVRPRNRHWAYCNFDARDYLASTQLMVIRNNPKNMTSILLFQYLINDSVWREFTLKTETRSGTFPQGNYEDLSNIRVPYNKKFMNISRQLENIYKEVYLLYDENSRLSTLRDTLLPRLMSGEIEIPE